MDILGLGRLPGDVKLRAGRATILFPVTSALVVSVVVTAALAVLSHAV